MSTFSVLGQNVVKKDALDKVMGTAQFAGDIFFDHMVYEIGRAHV